jgi:selenocysteine-specific elongation factor
MKRFIIGTAGHIDHGKTTLVKALTGVDTDRLKEEKQRGISIELGFAPFTLPKGLRAAIVDVPGHERFIRHMLAGAFGIDMVIFTVAADEGVMPQTREHMDIIELLGIERGIVVITKKDLVDEEWLLLVEEEIREYIEKTILKDAPVVVVSSVTNEGIEELLAAIEKIAEQIVEKPVFGQARLPIDRVFTVPGFGTVVTGTLWSGSINVGDNLELMPEQKIVKTRTLQVHGTRVATAYAGQRVAVNLQGVEVAEIKRGSLLCSPGFLSPSYRVDAKLKIIHTAGRTIKNWTRIRFHLGTDEAMGRVVLLDRDELSPGEEAYVQIVLETPVVCYKGDRFIIRYYSPVSTIGGGNIINSNAPKQKRFKEEVLDQLAMKEEGTLYDIILQEMQARPQEVISIEELTKRTGNAQEQVTEQVEQLVQDQRIVFLKPGEYISAYGLELFNEKIQKTLKEYHQKYPLRNGYPKEDMRSRYFKGINPKLFSAILKKLEEKEWIKVYKNELMLVNHKPNPGEKEQKAIDTIMNAMEKQLFSPQSIPDLKNLVQDQEVNLEEILAYLIESGYIIKINQDIYFSSRAIEEGKRLLEDYFAQEKELGIGQARDIFNTTRKYALPLIEYYDRVRFTRRVGDIRVKI